MIREELERVPGKLIAISTELRRSITLRVKENRLYEQRAFKLADSCSYNDDYGGVKEGYW